MTSGNLYDTFAKRFPKDDGAIFLETDRASTLYRDVDGETARYCGAMKAAGVDKGDRVIVQVEKSPEAVLLYLACLRVGAIFIPLNTAYTPAEVGYFLGDAAPRVFVCSPSTLDALMPVIAENSVPVVFTLDTAGGGSLPETLQAATPVEETCPCDDDDPAAILYTSGTTGRSKGAVLSHRNLASNAETLHGIWGFVPGDVLLHALPIFHVHGLFVALHCALFNGSKIIFLDRFDVDRVISELPRSTVMMGVPTFYVRLLANPQFGRAQCEKMRLFIAGSAPLLAGTFAEFEERTGHRILERYGMTEAGMITSNPYDGERIAGTVGFPLPGVSARVADDRGREVPQGEVGVLEISGPNVFSGYWRMPEKTKEEFREDGFFITGDMAVMDNEGRVSIVGRSKDLVITGGYNVYPKEIEVVIDAIPGVNESAVIGVPHPDFGEGVTAVVVRDGSAEVDEASIRRELDGRLASFKQPKAVIFADKLPRNTMGKVQKKALRDTYADMYQ